MLLLDCNRLKIQLIISYLILPINKVRFPWTNSWAIECFMWVFMRTFIMLSRDSIILFGVVADFWSLWHLVCAFILYIKPRHADSILWSYSISKILSSTQLYFILVWLFYTWFISILWGYVCVIHVLYILFCKRASWKNSLTEWSTLYEYVWNKI